MSTSNDSKKSVKAWWGPRAAVLGMVGFGALALAPLAWVAARETVAGNPVTLDEVQQKVKKMEEKKKEEQHGTEIKTALQLPDGKWLIGTKTGLLEGTSGAWTEVADYPGHDPKSLVASGTTVWVADKDGVHRRQDGKWSTVGKGDFHSLSPVGDGVIAVRKKPEPAILRISADGKAEDLKLDLPIQPKAEKEHAKEKDEKHEDH
jgi:hypothetical protein